MSSLEDFHDDSDLFRQMFAKFLNQRKDISSILLSPNVNPLSPAQLRSIPVMDDAKSRTWLTRTGAQLQAPSMKTARRHQVGQKAVANTSEKSYQCQFCQSTFSARGQLNRHTRRVHEKIKTEVCEPCGRLFFSKTDRDRHLSQVHHQRRKLSCLECNSSFKAKQNLGTHLKSVHKN